MDLLPSIGIKMRGAMSSRLLRNSKLRAFSWLRLHPGLAKYRVDVTGLPDHRRRVGCGAQVLQQEYESHYTWHCRSRPPPWKSKRSSQAISKGSITDRNFRGLLRSLLLRFLAFGGSILRAVVISYRLLPLSRNVSAENGARARAASATE